MPKRRKMNVANSSDEDEYDDDIDKFYHQKDKILLGSDEDGKASSEEEEVYPLVDSDEDDDDDDDDDDEELAGYKQQLIQLQRNKRKSKMDSDLEDEEVHEDKVAGWGSRRSAFMGGDVRDAVILSGSEEDEGAAALEEKEALLIKQRRLAQMTEDDFMMPPVAKVDSKQEERIEQVPADLSKMSRKEELEVLKRMHPEYLPLVKDLNAKADELRVRILPLMGLYKQGKLEGLGAEYAKMKYHIINNYLSNGAFYLYLMAKRTPGVHHHPIMQRLSEFQSFYRRLVPVDASVKASLDSLLQRLERGEDVGCVQTVDASQAAADRKPPSRKRKRAEAQAMEEEDEGEQKSAVGQGSSMGQDAEEGEEERRAITYQMKKNKGLTAHKKKELRNPRVKHRTKYRRAKIRRKGQVLDYKPPKQLYSGEPTGIRAGIIRSRKLH